MRKKLKTYKFRFYREVVQVDTFYREIKAKSEEEAQRLAEEMAEAANSDCPDDASQESGDDCGEWSAHPIED